MLSRKLIVSYKKGDFREIDLTLEGFKGKEADAYLWLFEDLDEEHVVLHGVDDDEHVSKVGGDDPAPVVPGMLRPHYVDLVIS